MVDTTPKKKINELPEAATVNDTDIMITQTTGSTPKTNRITMSTLLNKAKTWLLGVAPFSYIKNLTSDVQTQINQVNSNLLYIPSASTDGSTFGKDFANVSLTNPASPTLQASYFSKPGDDSGWKGIPPELVGKLWVGYRQVYRRSSVNILVQITEMYPTQGRIWSRFYNDGAWTAWKSITPQ